MNRIEFNDKMASRGRIHINLLAARLPNGQQVIFKFSGNSIPGISQVISENYHRNGKFSSYTWKVELSDNVLGFVRSQDWETGNWITSARWPEAIEEFKRKDALDEDAIERFIRAQWSSIASKLDANNDCLLSDGSESLKILLKAQEELATAQIKESVVAEQILAAERAEAARAEAKALNERTARAMELMKNGVTLADLKALLQG